MASVVSSGSDKSPPITPMALAVTNSILIIVVDLFNNFLTFKIASLYVLLI